jgi:hypothetical protein
MGCKTISGTVDGFSAVAIEAKTFKGSTFSLQLPIFLHCFKPKEDPLMSCDLNEIEDKDLGIWGFKRWIVV